MRVGDEKDPEEADTVGATTLRKEHVTLTSDAIKFDFLGKDSVRWQETVPAVANDKQFHENLKELTSKIKPTDEIFGNLTSRDVNEYYKTVVNGLTAKVSEHLVHLQLFQNILMIMEMSKKVLKWKNFITQSLQI